MLLPVQNVRQRQTADCLVACAAMVLAYLNYSATYAHIRQTLGTTPDGTPFSRLERLRSRHVGVDVGEGDLTILQTHLINGLPVIVDVRTWTMLHWQMRTDLEPVERDTDHALVVVGMDGSNIYANDPDYAVAPVAVSVNAFLAAWVERDQRYAVIR